MSHSSGWQPSSVLELPCGSELLFGYLLQTFAFCFSGTRELVAHCLWSSFSSSVSRVHKPKSPWQRRTNLQLQLNSPQVLQELLRDESWANNDFLISWERPGVQRNPILLDSLLAAASNTRCSLKSVCSSYFAWSLPARVHQIRPWRPSWKVAEWSAVFGLSQHHQNYLRLPAAWDLWPVSLLRRCALIEISYFQVKERGLFQAD